MELTTCLCFLTGHTTLGRLLSVPSAHPLARWNAGHGLGRRICRRHHSGGAAAGAIFATASGHHGNRSGSHLSVPQHYRVSSPEPRVALQTVHASQPAEPISHHTMGMCSSLPITAGTVCSRPTSVVAPVEGLPPGVAMAKVVMLVGGLVSC